MVTRTWPSKNIYFCEGVAELVKTYGNRWHDEKKDLVFIDFSRENLREALSENFLFFLSEGARMILISDDFMLPLALYYRSVSARICILSKKNSISGIMTCINNRNCRNPCKENDSVIPLNKGEFLVLRNIVVNHLMVKEISKLISTPEKTVYSRCDSILRKMKENNIKRLAYS